MENKQISEDVPRTFSNAALNLCANHTDGNPSMNKLPVFKTRKARTVCIYSSCPCPLGFSNLFSLSPRSACILLSSTLIAADGTKMF